jgi:hypothetical protein
LASRSKLILSLWPCAAQTGAEFGLRRAKVEYEALNEHGRPRRLLERHLGHRAAGDHRRFPPDNGPCLRLLGMPPLRERSRRVGYRHRKREADCAGAGCSAEVGHRVGDYPTCGYFVEPFLSPPRFSTGMTPGDG